MKKLSQIKWVNKSLLRNSMIYIAFVVLVIVFAITLKDVGNGFLDSGNLWNIIRQTALIAILGVCLAFALGAGQIDLSVGSNVAVTSLVVALAIRSYGIFIGIAAGLIVGLLIGALNGVLIAYWKVPAFLATLGSQIVFSGVARTMTGLQSIPIINKTFIKYFGSGTIGDMPILLIWMIVIVAFGHILLRKLPFGRKVIAIGGNPKAAQYSGINVNFTIFKVMVLSGLLASAAGVLWAGRFGGGRYSLGEGAETSAIAASVLGGTSIYGGVASVIGAMIGAVMIGMIDNALVMYGFDVYQQMIVRGAVIILAVAVTVKRGEN
jgi:ribose transport system permease protein